MTVPFSPSVVQLSVLVGDAAEATWKEPGDAGLSWERDVLFRQTAGGRTGPSWRNL